MSEMVKIEKKELDRLLAIEEKAKELQGNVGYSIPYDGAPATLNYFKPDGLEYAQTRLAYAAENLKRAVSGRTDFLVTPPVPEKGFVQKIAEAIAD